MLLDAATGVPLSVRLSALFGVKGDAGRPGAGGGGGQGHRAGRRGGRRRAARPGLLPDERKPKGVARALEQAGLRKSKGAGAETPAPEGRRPPSRRTREADAEE